MRYDTELQGYLRTNGLQASDLIKPRAKKTAKDPSPSKKSKSQQQPKAAAPPTTPDQPTALNHSSVAQPTPAVYHASEEGSMVLPSFGQVWSNADPSSHRDLLAQVVYDSHLHDEREGTTETENPNPIFRYNVAMTMVDFADSETGVPWIGKGNQVIWPYLEAGQAVGENEIR